jgi:hypothetical protein
MVENIWSEETDRNINIEETKEYHEDFQATLIDYDHLLIN